MGKGSLIKIGIALFIAASYLFIFGITERVSSDSDQDSAAATIPGESNEPAPSQTATAAPISGSPQESQNAELTFPAYSSLDVEPLIVPFAPNAAVLLPAGYEELFTSVVTTKEPNVRPVTTEKTNPPTTKPNETTSQKPKPAVTTAATTQKPSNPSGKTLRVKYNGSGGAVDEDAMDILAKVVMGEIGSSFNKEAIKAQAVASYTYIKYYNNNGSAPTVTVKEASDTVKECVKEVFGQAVYYNNELIQAVYCPSSAGYTASSKSVWGIDYPYLQSVKCELDSLYDPNYGVKTSFTPDEMKEYVKTATGIELDGDPGNWFAIKNYVDNVYVGSFSIGGKTTYTDSEGKEIAITGKLMREKIMNYNLRSSCFNISYSPETDKFTFTTYGYGHGAGLSQNGANNLAKAWGYSYKDILKYYYPGTEVK